MTPKESVLARARFDPRLATYFHLQALLVLSFTFVFIPVAFLWFLVGRGFHRRQYERLSCELTTRTLNVKRGVLVRVQQSVPLDKITDLALVEGPLLRRLGLCALRIETAGGGQATSTGQAMLIGVVDAETFRDQVLAQRDAVVFDGAAATGALEVRPRGALAGVGDQTLDSGQFAERLAGRLSEQLTALRDEALRSNVLLTEIRDHLARPR